MLCWRIHSYMKILLTFLSSIFANFLFLLGVFIIKNSDYEFWLFYPILIIIAFWLVKVYYKIGRDIFSKSFLSAAGTFFYILDGVAFSLLQGSEIKSNHIIAMFVFLVGVSIVYYGDRKILL